MLWPYFYPWPQRPPGLIEQGFAELARRWRPILDQFDAEGVDLAYEIHPGEAIEEKISLSERFGLWISFYPFSQDDYLDIVRHWLRHFGVSAAKIAGCERNALNWALGRGSRSGRVAWQFARDLAGHGNSAQKRSK